MLVHLRSVEEEVVRNSPVRAGKEASRALFIINYREIFLTKICY